ncbi:MAG: ATP-binding protein [Lachnospiraceae bacterium]|jgi:hypothetical protein|nr:ATP-binding protein [Lachnospiraceae bacterium]MCI1334387.1 ATP-binding protein [Lachnospiraceae bacterium]MCI1358567.1 ATP-binding protein [Lachnospiraceae bacterium]MCI1378806.1 ATP-binding protein [Lachnospiraceae bacterium]MCI1455315.1 ATP-binding protein [Lachnospiraceae bacterium]
MRGKYHIHVSNRALSFDFTLSRNITIICGDSATGKTTLVDMIREYELQGTDSAVQISCEKPCVVVEGNSWKRQLRELESESIVFIDEGNRFVSSQEFAEAAQNSGNYYVIVTRENLYNLPYSVTEIYGIKSSGKYNSLRPVYHELYRVYGEKVDDSCNIYNTVITEDSHSGFQFFKDVCSDTVTCVPADGNSNILAMIRKAAAENTTPCLVIADGSAFGAFMAQIHMFMEHRTDVHLYLPESFEWLILTSGLIDGNRVRDILETPEKYIESSQYFSWEQFFTATLIDETKDSYLRYQKSSLNPAYLRKREKEAILAVIPKAIRENL